MFVYVIHELVNDMYLAKSADAFGRVTHIYTEKFHAFQFTPDQLPLAQAALVQEQVRGHIVELEQVDLA